MTFDIVKGPSPGCIDRVVELHGTYYRAHSGFGPFFENKIATEFTAFLQRYDEKDDGLWLLRAGEKTEGCIVIDGGDEQHGAHLRWFIVSDRLRGSGAGNALLSAALAFCDERKFSIIRLWTFEGLHAARHLYEKHGFQLMEERRGTRWGAEVTEQLFELQLPVA